MKRKQTAIAFLAALAVSSLSCHATVIWLQNGDSEKQYVNNTVLDSSTGGRSVQLYTKDTHLPNQAFNVGDSFTASWDVKVTAASPDPIPWSGNANIAFAVNDDVTDHAVGMTFDLTGTTQFRTGYDKSAPGAGNFSTLSGTSSGWVNHSVAAENLLNLNDTALITFTLEKTDSDATGDELVHTVKWGSSAIATHTIAMSEGVRINQLDEFLWRMNALDGTSGAATATLGVTNFELNLVPEPGTLSLVAMVGGGLLFIRRRFLI